MLILRPSRVIFSLPLSSCKRRFFSSSARCFSRYFLQVPSSGSTNISPVKPSTIALQPSWISFRKLSPAPITAGIFIFLASIAVWELDEPWAVTNARTLSLSSETVSLGAISEAQIMTFSSEKFPFEVSPVRLLIILFEMSRTSAARAFM